MLATLSFLNMERIMKLLPLNHLGAREVPTGSGIIEFGIVLPGICAKQGDRVSAFLIPETEQFAPCIHPVEITLKPASHAQVDSAYGEYWTGRILVRKTNGPQRSSLWGEPGVYAYYYSVHSGDGRAENLSDPCARQFGRGGRSVLTVGDTPYDWSGREGGWKTPHLSDLIVYEMQITEFGGSIEETIRLLDYVGDLGANAIEILPVTHAARSADWGYSPTGYFALDARLGNRKSLQALVDAAHQRGIAVLLDMVYAHTSRDFAYASLYAQLGRANPVMDPGGMYGPTPRFDHPLMADFFYSVNHHWLETCHVDGFRYDNVDGYWDGHSPEAYYPALTEATYRLVQRALQTQCSEPHWRRFLSPGEPEPQLIQCAELLSDPPAALNNSYANAVQQNWTLAAARQAAHGGSLNDLGRRLGLEYFPESVTLGEDTLVKRGFQYIETHDHPRFVCNYGTHLTDVLQTDLLREGHRDAGVDVLNNPYPARWFRVQPYLIGLFTGKGVPLLRQGQEFGENDYTPIDWRENERKRLFRPLRWEYATDAIGQRLSRLVRRLIRIRRGGGQFREGSHFFYDDYELYQSRGLLLFSRQSGTRFSLVALNFTDQTQTTGFAFPTSGNYKEELENGALIGVKAGVHHALTIPANYGCVWSRVGSGQ